MTLTNIQKEEQFEDELGSCQNYEDYLQLSLRILEHLKSLTHYKQHNSDLFNYFRSHIFATIKPSNSQQLEISDKIGKECLQYCEKMILSHYKDNANIITNNSHKERNSTKIIKDVFYFLISENISHKEISPHLTNILVNTASNPTYIKYIFFNNKNALDNLSYLTEQKFYDLFKNCMDNCPEQLIPHIKNLYFLRLFTTDNSPCDILNIDTSQLAQEYLNNQIDFYFLQHVPFNEKLFNHLMPKILEKDNIDLNKSFELYNTITTLPNTYINFVEHIDNLNNDKKISFIEKFFQSDNIGLYHDENEVNFIEMFQYIRQEELFLYNYQQKSFINPSQISQVLPNIDSQIRKKQVIGQDMSDFLFNWRTICKLCIKGLDNKDNAQFILKTLNTYKNRQEDIDFNNLPIVKYFNTYPKEIKQFQIYLSKDIDSNLAQKDSKISNKAKYIQTLQTIHSLLEHINLKSLIQPPKAPNKISKF